MNINIPASVVLAVHPTNVIRKDTECKKYNH